ncbi:VOC family protein [Marispirochaeta aestuarii]|uniref:VOC family protein n=1 Tax=Marispirochaeta aestuarii TaxID=1963862 RepID=UPI0029C6182F|nr:VOC family protein [Marispirochaeta aestuarii]
MHGYIEHLGIMAGNTRILAEWYQSVLGFTILVEIPGEAPTFLLRQAGGGAFLEIMPKSDECSMPDSSGKSFMHIALRVENFDAALEGLRSLQIPIEKIKSAPGNAQLAFFRDPEGNLLQFVYRAGEPEWLS